MVILMQRKDAEDNARKVIKWTKRVIVEMDQTDQVSETSDIIRPSRSSIYTQNNQQSQLTDYKYFHFK